jgi:hypothetical protein
MGYNFAGREFDNSDVVGFQLRVLPELVEWPTGWPREECVLNLSARHVLSSCPVVWPRAIRLGGIGGSHSSDWADRCPRCLGCVGDNGNRQDRRRVYTAKTTDGGPGHNG